MILNLNRWASSHASGRNVLLTFLLAVGSLLFMALVITPAFESATSGLRPFDLNFDIDAAKMYADLPAYTEQSRQLYLAFAFVDYIYPAAVAAFFILLWLWLFAKAPNRIFSQLTSYGLLLIPLVYMSVDWSENAGFLFVIFSYPEQHPGVANITGAFKAIKPMVMNVMLLLTFIIAVVVIAQRLRAWRRRHSATGGKGAN